MRRIAWITMGIVALGVGLSVSVHWSRTRGVSLPLRGPDGPIWQFNFGPERSPDFPDFAKVDASTVYDPARGYGWLDLDGDLMSGNFHDPNLSWESTRNLNLIQRAGPDALAGSHANGSATFAVDVEPGSYDVWVLSGDFGLLEYVPHEPFAIEVEGSRIGFEPPSPQEWIRRFETPGPDDTIDDAEAYDRYVAPRFRWKMVTVPVSDAQLSVRVAGGLRDGSGIDYIGYYAYSDLKYGPPRRFTGALCAMIVTPSHPHGLDLADAVDALRRSSFPQRRREQRPDRNLRSPDGSELRRGYSLFPLNSSDTVVADTIRPHEEPRVRLRAAPGELVPLSWAVRPHRELGTTRIQVEALRGPGAMEIAPANIQVAAVRYAARPLPGDGARVLWSPRPGTIVPGDRWQLTVGVTKQLWATISVPDEMEAGVYAGALVVAPELGEPSTVRVELEVLPFRLKRPTHLATGLTYFVPVVYALLGEERLWSRVRADFEDMRRHHMTTVQLTGMGIENHDGLERLLTEYRYAQFERPVYLLEAYAAIEHIADRYGYERDTEDFYSKYEAIFRHLSEAAKRRRWPPLIMNFGDEFTNDAREEFGAELARRLARIPGITTAVDANGLREVSLLAPHVSIVGFNRGWDGPTGVNRGRPSLLRADTVALIRAARATPWLVNIGRNRMSAGLYLWKMARLGVGGRIEWIYGDYQADPHNPFDGQGLAWAPLAHPGPAGTTLSSLSYERIRLGLDDLAYLHTLEESARAAAPGPQRDRAEQLLEEIDRKISDEYATYEGPAADRWTDERIRGLRDAVIDMILQLQRGT